MQVKDTGLGMGDSSGQVKSYTGHDFNKRVCLVHADTLTNVLLVLLLCMVHLHVQTSRTVPTLNKLSI